MATEIRRSKERLYIVLNEQFSPPKEFGDRTLTFKEPSKVDEHDRNTLVTIEGIPGRGYYGEVDVYYDRLSLSDMVEPFIYRTLTTINHHNLANAISNKTGIDLSPHDVISFEIPQLEDGDTRTVEVFASPRSLQWTGSVSIVVEYGRSWLDTSIGRTSLGVLAHPNDTPKKMYGRMLGWKVDFSGALDSLKRDKRGRYTDWQTVRYITALLGWPAWNESTITDRATADVPDSNPDFERVIIQYTVSSSRIVGPIYFHYNPIQGYQ